MNNNQYEIYHENKAHTTPDFPYNAYLCSIPLDFPAVNTHWHNEAELIVIKNGAGIVTVDLVPYQVKTGDFIFILPGQLHSIEQKEDYIMEYENILFEPSMLISSEQNLCSEYLQLLFSGRIGFPPLIDDKLSYYISFAKCIENIDFLSGSRPFGYQLGIKGNLFQLVFLLITNNAVKEQTSNKKSIEKVKSILAYISENYSRHVTVEEAAAHCFYSKSYFMKFFKDSMGMGFIQYLNNYRLEIASQLLLSTTDNILDIAMKTGFDNLSYFNRMFKNKYGVPPGKYRR